MLVLAMVGQGLFQLPHLLVRPPPDHFDVAAAGNRSEVPALASRSARNQNRCV